MPQIKPDVPPPFDHGVFLLHYNRGREAFQEGRYGEARRELEHAQRFRPDDADVLNLLGLVYFKTNAYPEAEVIYRRLVNENPDVFILHSNLGLILYKQGKGDEAERFLTRAIELRPNYAKSHLYLGMLYRDRKQYPLAVEHLQFAGAEKLVKDVQSEMLRLKANSTQPIQALKPQEYIRTQEVSLASVVGEGPSTKEIPVPPPPSAAPADTGQQASRKLQEAVDEPRAEQRMIELDRKIEGASKTFALHENGFLEINFRKSVFVKKGTVSSYSGNLKFTSESGFLGTTAATLIKAEGHGKLFLYEKGKKAFLLDLNDEFIYVEGSNLLALEDTLSFRIEPIYDTTYQKKIDTIKIFGKGSLAISTSIEPLTLRVTREYPLSISSVALVAWTGNLIPSVIDDSNLANVMIAAADQTFKIRFEGDGIVVSEQ